MGKQTQEVTKQQRVPAFGKIVDKVYATEGLEKKTGFPVGPNIRFSATFNCAKPINSGHIERLEPESVRVKKGSSAIETPRNKKSYVLNGLPALTYSWCNQYCCARA